MQKNLGGNRLGSGAKINVDLHHYERSTHHLGYIFRTTMAPGTLVPFCKKVMLPGDTFDVFLDADVKTHPTTGPLFGSFKFQADMFFVPFRLYIGLLHNNLIDIGLNMGDIKFPTMDLKGYWDNSEATNEDFDIDNSQINPSCILSYLGIRGIGTSDDLLPTWLTRTFNATGLLAYWDIIKNYYINKQQQFAYVIHTALEELTENVQTIEFGGSSTTVVPAYPTEANIPANVDEPPDFIITTTGGEPKLDQIYIKTSSGWFSVKELTTGNLVDLGTNVYAKAFDIWKFGELNVNSWRYRSPYDIPYTEPTLYPFDISNLDDMRRAILSHNTFSAFNLNNMDELPTPYSYLLPDDNIPQLLCSQEGLAVKTYQSDLFNNWLRTSTITAINTATAISTVGDSFTIDALRLGKKLNDLLNRVAVAGGTYYDWIETVYTSEIMNMAEIPIYHGGLSKEVVFQEVVSNSESQGAAGTSPLGQLAGRGIMANKHKGGHVVIKPVEPGFLMGIVSLTPRIDYSQGNDFDVHLQSLDDLHKPALDQIGFQDLITEQMAWWDTNRLNNVWTLNSAGKQPAWINYMTSVNKTYGNFAIKNNEMFMTLNRRYSPVVTSTGAHITDLTTYIDPKIYNNIFSQTSLDAQNFWVQIAVDITARRKMSAKVMPTL